MTSFSNADFKLWCSQYIHFTISASTLFSDISTTFYRMNCLKMKKEPSSGPFLQSSFIHLFLTVFLICKHENPLHYKGTEKLPTFLAGVFSFLYINSIYIWHLPQMLWNTFAVPWQTALLNPLCIIRGLLLIPHSFLQSGAEYSFVPWNVYFPQILVFPGSFRLPG